LPPQLHDPPEATDRARRTILAKEDGELVIHIVGGVLGSSDRAVVPIVLIVLLVAVIAIVLVIDLVLEVSIVARAGVFRVVLLFSLCPVDDVALAIGFLPLSPGFLLRHAADWINERPGYDSYRCDC
jgi:hypothetical protein